MSSPDAPESETLSPDAKIFNYSRHEHLQSSEGYRCICIIIEGLVGEELN